MTAPYKLYRSDGPETSKAAAESLNITRLEKIVYDTVKSFGSSGCIQDDVLKVHSGTNLGSNYGSFTGRFGSLKEKKKLFESGRKRKGESGKQQIVLVADEFLTPVEQEILYNKFIERKNKLTKKERDILQKCIKIVDGCVDRKDAINKMKSLIN